VKPSLSEYIRYTIRVRISIRQQANLLTAGACRFEQEGYKLRHSVNQTRHCKAMLIAVLFMVVLPLVVPLDIAQARRGRDDDNRTEFHGIVQSRPKQILEGAWVIGGRTFQADAGTEFDQREGKLTAGSCAKVHIRNGRVHEIDSEPMRNCR